MLNAEQREPIGLVAAMRVGGRTGANAGTGPERSKYDELNREAPNCFEVVDPDRAELLIYPYRAETGPEIEKTADQARKRNIGCVFFSWGDADQPVKVSYGTVYRHSLFADQRADFEHAMAAEVSDPILELKTPILSRQKRDIPSVGFCGFVSNPIMRTIYRLSGRQRKVEGLAMRTHALRVLKRTKYLETHFVTRQSYWAGKRGRFHKNVAGEFKPRAAFWDNVINNDYTLCMRGAGNFSYRFYEVLAAGRIPLFINTRCVLPFEDEIDWRKHCVWVEENEIESAGDIVKKFHARFSAEEFRELQLANRRLWETKLSPLGFFKTVFAKEVQRHPAGVSQNTT